MRIREMSRKHYLMMVKNGFHEVNLETHAADSIEMQLDIRNKLLLIGSELSEAFDELRNGHQPHEVYYSITNHGAKPEGFGIELADVVLCIMGLCENLHIPLEDLLIEKMAYNAKRPLKHGKEF